MKRAICVLMLLVMLAGLFSPPAVAGPRGRTGANSISPLMLWLMLHVPVPPILWTLIYGPNTWICSQRNPDRPEWCGG